MQKFKGPSALDTIEAVTGGGGDQILAALQEHFLLQPKIAGYRQLSPDEVALMNEGKALAEQVGVWIGKLRGQPSAGSLSAFGAEVSVDQRWVSVGATQLQQGFMAAIRGIAQPSTF